MRRFLLAISTLVLVICFQAEIKAQDVASITGVVTDSTGAVIPGVSVKLENASTSSTYNATTNSLGSYSIVNAQPGPGYQVTFTRDGFKPVVITGIYLNVDTTRTQNAQMSAGGGSQTVEVSASAQNVTLDTTDATVGNNFEVQFINDLPIQFRDTPSALFYQQPGVTLDGAVTGARVDQSNVSVDGLDVNDMATGNFGSIVADAPVDSVQEFRGVTAGELSSSGEGGGGQFELVTRSGTNQFHGALDEYHRDVDLEANDWFNNDTGVGRPPLIRNQFGGNVGGPIRKDKAFFFFDWNSRRDTLTNLVERTVPMPSLRSGEVSYVNSAGGVSTLSSAQVAGLDPLKKGFDPALLSVITSRYPAPNDFSGAAGDLINSAGFRFNAPFPFVENNYVGRVDYRLNDAQSLWGRVTFARQASTQNAIQFPGDPETYPFLDKSYAAVVGDTWLIGANKTNRASFGETVTKWDFPNTYNPTGLEQYLFGTIISGGEFLSSPYASAINAQSRTYPIPVVKDDFTWQKGSHSIAFGGTFKFANPVGKTILNYYSPAVGLGGHLSNLNTSAPQPSLRPSDISTDSAAVAAYDTEYTFALGRYQSIDSVYDYNAQGNLLPEGTGSTVHYRYFETELYAGDTWKLTPSLTFSYGVRWQNYSVPYEIDGIESIPSLNFEQYFGARLAQSAAGQTGNQAIPFISYSLGGKANHAPGYFNPQYTNFAPRFALAYSPSVDRKLVLSAGAGEIFDHTVINAVQYQAFQYSYLFQTSANRPYGISGNPIGSLETDPRFGGFNNPPPALPAPGAIKSGYMPFVSGTGTSAVPFGLINGQAFNEGVDHSLTNPYSVAFNAGFEHEIPHGFILKATYVGRLGRKLLAQADANQLIEFPDSTGKSNQTMSQAMGGAATQLRKNAGLGPLGDILSLAPQPWYEDMLPGFAAAVNSLYGTNLANNTQAVAYYAYPLPQRGDFADTTQALAATGFLAPNVGMGSQFSEDTYYTNKGTSNYHGLLVTLHKNAGRGLQFDLNYTYSHSIDNVSIAANTPALGGYGFLCDAVRLEECRGNSDFDVTHYLNGNFIYELPIGRGQTFAPNTPFWANEIIGGWEISGLPSWHTGNVYFADANAFVAGYANDAPAILTGPISDLKATLHKDPSGTLWAYKNDDAPATADYIGPVGFQIGSRNNLRGPGYFNFDLGLGKTFPVYGDRVNLKFRCDAFNAFNHPNFEPPTNGLGGTPFNTDITESQAKFGIVSSTVIPPGSDQSARVLQLSLRLEF
jgi:hypothetical protein